VSFVPFNVFNEFNDLREVIDKHKGEAQSPNETTFTLRQLTPRPPLHEGEKQPVQQKRKIRSSS
jgi:hypothetical protein